MPPTLANPRDGPSRASRAAPATPRCRTRTTPVGVVPGRLVSRTVLGSIQGRALPSVRASHPTIHRPSRPARAAGRAWATWPATCAGPGTRRRRTSSRRSTRAAVGRRGHDPVRLLGAVGPRAARRAGRRRGVPRAAAGRDRADLERLPHRRPLVPAPQGRRRTRPASIAYFSPEYGITAVLPQYSGGLGILAGDHLKAASDLGIPLVGVGLLYRHGYFKQSLSREGWQQETYPVLDPDELPLTLLREADGSPRHRLDRPARRPPLLAPHLGRPRRPGAAAAPRHRRRGEPAALPRRHRPPVRRQQRAPAPPGAAARRRRRPRAARLLPDHRRPGARGVPHQRGPRRLPRHRADPRAHRRRGRPRPRLRHRARGVPRRHGLHHAHPGARRHRPVPARAGRAVLRRRGVPDPRRARRPGARARRRGLRRRRRRRSSTWRSWASGSPSAPTASPSCTATCRRGMFNGLWPAFDEAEVPIGSITNGVHGPTWIAREIFDLAAELGADVDADDTDALWPLVDQIPGKRAVGPQAHPARQARRRRPRPAGQVVGQARLRAGRARLDRDGARPRRADHRLRAPRAVVQAAHADAARPRRASSGCCSTPSARSSWSSPASRTRPTTAARSSSRRWCASPTTPRSGTASSSCPTTTSRWRSRSTPAATCGSTTRCAPTRRAARPA